MSYIHKPHNHPLEFRLPFQLLHEHAKAHPNKEAFVFRDMTSKRTPITFQEYESKSQSLAAGLLEIGLVRGDRVLLMVPTCPEFVFIHMALNRIGVVAIVLEEDTYQAINDIYDVACVITTLSSSSPHHDNMVAEIRKVLQQDKFKANVIVGPADDDDLVNHCHVYTYDSLYAMSEKNAETSVIVQCAESQVQLDDPTLVMFTSGSTSLPKPIEYTNHGFVNGAHADIQMMKMNQQSVLFLDSPFDWISGNGFGISVVIVLGSTLVSFPPRLAFKGGCTTTILKVVEEEYCTHSIFLGYFLQDMTLNTDISDIDLNKFKVCVTGGQPTTINLLKQILAMLPGLTVINTYGATEFSITTHQEITKENVVSVDLGLMDVVSGVELKVIDDVGQLVSVGFSGELCVRSAWVSFCKWDLFPGLEQPAPSTKTSNGWHQTNDRAVLDSNGRLKLLGRMDSMIKCATESVPPMYVEETLLEHPDVHKVCVVGVPDQRLHEKICACIILKEGNHGNTDSLPAEFDEWCKDQFFESAIGLYLKPHYFVFVDSFPLTRTGKLSRKLMRQTAIATLGI